MMDLKCKFLISQEKVRFLNEIEDNSKTREN